MLTEAEFRQQWKVSKEAQDPVVIETAWRRYQQVQSEGYKIIPESIHPSLSHLQADFEQLLNHPSSRPLWENSSYLSLTANIIPWTPTGIHVSEDQAVSVFATGRTWRSKLLDLYLPPQFNLWYRIGVNGSIFNSTHDTRTFKCIDGQSGELYLANQFPGGFHDRFGGRVGGQLSAYENAEGCFNIAIVQWRQAMPVDEVRFAIQRVLENGLELYREGKVSMADPAGLLTIAIQRMSSDYFIHRFPAGWKLLWFLGVSEIFSQEQVPPERIGTTPAALASPSDQPTSPSGPVYETDLASPIDRTPTSQTMIRCTPNHNVGILQKDLPTPIPLTPHTTTTWTWNILSLPSRLREDTTLTHDYFSLAFEFENGRDLTYTWSWELPVSFGYWCPLAAWCDREYHVVIRSGTELLGTWLDERRNIFEDYVAYVNGGDVGRRVPGQIVRVWLIAGNRWQRYEGEMLIKDIRIQVRESEDVVVL